MRFNYGNKVYGYVIMPNHIHVLLEISDSSPIISKLIQNAKRFLAYQIITLLKQDKKEEILNVFANQAQVNKKAQHKVFADRYDSKFVADLDFFNEKLNYIHNNPCQAKWQLAKLPEQYPHSSASNYYLGKGYYDIDIMTS